jgi:hypothetical protein
MARPLRPEPKFFLIDKFFERGLPYYKSHFFREKTGAWLKGEKSTSYMESEKVAHRIAQYFSGAKILFVLRNPIERAISNYWFSVSNGLETLPMAEAFLREEERWREYDPTRTSVSPYAYLRRGRYVNYISIYERYFSSENMKIIIYEQLVESLEAIRELYQFLGVAPDFKPSALQQVVNQEIRPDVPLSTPLYQYLLDYFATSNACLAERFDLNLTHWRET